MKRHLSGKGGDGTLKTKGVATVLLVPGARERSALVGRINMADAANMQPCDCTSCSSCRCTPCK